MNKQPKPLAYYLGLNYPITIIPADEGGYVAKVKDLPGCVTQGETLAEVAAMIEDARRAWLEDAHTHNDPIPEPKRADAYSGKFIVRAPKSLHQHLVERAEEEGVSLNQFVVALLSRQLRT